MTDLIISVSGIRGVVGGSLDAGVARKWGAAFGCLHKGKRIVIGRDSRASGPELSQALIEGIVSQGADAIDAGLVPTPVLETGVLHLKASGGVMITASHNPSEYNGFKFFGADGIVVNRETGTRLRKTAEGDIGDCADRGSVSAEDSLISVHVKRVINSIDAEAVRSAGFKITVDGCGSSGGPALVCLLDELGCETIQIDCEPNGKCARQLEPRAEVLGELSKAMDGSDAVAGFAVDPDGDRLVVATEDGTVLSEEYTVPLVAMQMLAGTNGEKIVVNLSTSRMIEDVAAMFDASVERSPVGERNVVEAMQKCGGIVGGEGNGGVMVPAVNPSRDGVVGTAYVLALMASRKKPLSEIASGIPSYSMIKVKVPVSRKDFTGKREELEREFEGAAINMADGLHASWSDRWIHIRPSGTEPVVRIIAEAPDEAGASTLIDRAKEALSPHPVP